MSRITPYLLLIVLLGISAYLVSGWLAPARQAAAFQQSINEHLLMTINKSVDIEQIRADIATLARDSGVTLERGTLHVVLGTPNLMSEAGLQQAKEEGFYPERALIVTARIEAGSGYARRTFSILAERGFAPGTSPKPVTMNPKVPRPSLP